MGFKLSPPKIRELQQFSSNRKTLFGLIASLLEKTDYLISIPYYIFPRESISHFSRSRWGRLPKTFALSWIGRYLRAKVQNLATANPRCYMGLCSTTSSVWNCSLHVEGMYTDYVVANTPSWPGNGNSHVLSRCPLSKVKNLNPYSFTLYEKSKASKHAQQEKNWYFSAIYNHEKRHVSDYLP